MPNVTCPSCGKSLRIPEQFAGKRGTCKGCGGWVDVPVKQDEQKTVSGKLGGEIVASTSQTIVSVTPSNASKKRRFLSVVVMVAFASIVLGVVFYSTSTDKEQPIDPGASLAGQDDLESIYERARKSTVSIFIYNEQGDRFASGTGFYFRTNLIATNLHVVEGGYSFVIRNVSTGNEFTGVKIKSYSEDSDVAILEVEEKATPLPIVSREFTPSVGQEVYVIGNPKEYEGTLSTGVVSGLRVVDGNDEIQITAPISGGSSGGPVLDKDGIVIGIVRWTRTDSQNINFAIPASILLDLENKHMAWTPKIVAKRIAVAAVTGPKLPVEEAFIASAKPALDEIADNNSRGNPYLEDLAIEQAGGWEHVDDLISEEIKRLFQKVRDQYPSSTDRQIADAVYIVYEASYFFPEIDIFYSFDLLLSQMDFVETSVSVLAGRETTSSTGRTFGAMAGSATTRVRETTITVKEAAGLVYKKLYAQYYDPLFEQQRAAAERKFQINQQIQQNKAQMREATVERARAREQEIMRRNQAVIDQQRFVREESEKTKRSVNENARRYRNN